VASLVVYDVMKELNKQKIENFEDCPLPPERLGILVDAVAEGIVSGTTSSFKIMFRINHCSTAVSNAKLVIPHLFASSKSVAQIIEEVIPTTSSASILLSSTRSKNNWRQIDDPEEAERFCRSCFSNSPVVGDPF
jgi:Asp-tRNA(Asn)/Glu-tRNA(Gln) amidotransferase B subunit